MKKKLSASPSMMDITQIIYLFAENNDINFEQQYLCCGIIKKIAIRADQKKSTLFAHIFITRASRRRA
jgi:hypothetical protein